MADPGDRGPWEWRTLGMGDPNQNFPGLVFEIIIGIFPLLLINATIINERIIREIIDIY